MSEHRATIKWKAGEGDFAKGRYSREHTWTFDGGMVVSASSSPAVVPVPMSNPAYVDPEEAFVASLSSCHMLTFLAICARKRFAVDAYDDEAEGTLEKGPKGKLWMAHVTLRPRVRFASGVHIDAATLAELHHLAHRDCFIANSVNTEIAVEPRD